MIEKYVSYSHGITLPNHDLFTVFYKHTLRGLRRQAAALQIVEGNTDWCIVKSFLYGGWSCRLFPNNYSFTIHAFLYKNSSRNL